MAEMTTALGEWPAYWRREPRREAIVDVASGRRWSYGELADAVDRATGWLALRGIERGARVAVLAQNCVETLLLLFACARCGAILVPLNTRLTAVELASLVADADPALLLYDSLHADTALSLAAARPCVPLQCIRSEAAPGVACRPVDSESPVLILYTSGTSGRAKGALLSQRMVYWNAVNTTVSWDLSGQDSALVHTPFFHTGGLHVLTTPLLMRGGRLVLLPAFAPSAVLSVLASERISVLFAVPTMFQMLASEPGFAAADFSSVRFCISGGAPCPARLIEQYQARGLVFKQGYGLTEVGPNCFTLPADDAVRKLGSVGFANFATRARVVDEAGADVASHAVGELWLAGPTVCSGYWRNAEATAAAFSGEWFKTGDLFRIDDEGYAWIVDRKKDMYISGGENVYPAEVEAVLLAHPAIAEAAVIGRQDAFWGEVGEAHLVLRAGQAFDRAELQDYLDARLARYKQPKAYVFSTSLPRTPTGKVIKSRLKGS